MSRHTFRYKPFFVGTWGYILKTSQVAVGIKSFISLERYLLECFKLKNSHKNFSTIPTIHFLFLNGKLPQLSKQWFVACQLVRALFTVMIYSDYIFLLQPLWNAILGHYKQRLHMHKMLQFLQICIPVVFRVYRFTFVERNIFQLPRLQLQVFPEL